MASLAQLKRLLAKRSQIQQKLTNIENFSNQSEVNTEQITINPKEINNRIEEMYKLRQEFENVNLDITCHDNDTSDEQGGQSNTTDSDLAESIAFDKLWYSVLSQLQVLLEKYIPVSSAESSVASINLGQGNPQFNIKLPVINLPTFSGKHTEWLPFYDAFQSLIHNNNSLDNCQKFHYLKSCLKDEASRAIESLSISSDNYQSAWSVLQKRYKNTRLIIQAHVQTILNTPEIKKCSSESIQKLIDDVTNNLEALKVLKIPIDTWDAILVTIISNKLDYQTRREFENSLDCCPISLNQMTEFLEKKRSVLESLNQSISQKQDKPFHLETNNANARKVHRPKFNHTANAAVQSAVPKMCCYYCKGHHFIGQCDNFLRLTISERINEIKRRNLCLNCFRANHTLSQCKASGCRTCQSRLHNTLIHGSSQQSVGTVNHFTSSVNTHVVLSTAMVLIKNCSGTFQKCRALLDVGSQLNIMSESLRSILNLKINKQNITIAGINNTCNNTLSQVQITIQSLNQSFEATVECCILTNVTTNLPSESFDKTTLQIPANLKLADPNFNINGPIDLLLGAEVFWALLRAGRRKIANPSLYLSNTSLGWVVGGALFEEPKGIASCNLVISKKNADPLNDLLERFWVQEEIADIQNNWTKEERDCEEQFVNTYQRDPRDGRFIVELPFKNNKIDLGNSERNALRRFIALERKFRKDNNYKQNYCKAIKELLENGYLEEVTASNSDDKNQFYLPHSGVVKCDSNNSKMRIVYDGSAASSNGLSLNDNLLTGPNLQNDLFEILLRFRTYQTVISCDMEKMFLQIKIHPEHTKFQLLYWRFNESEVIKTFKLTRLIFGLTNSPYTAMRCVNQLASEAQHKFPVASRALAKDRFMDDILTGTDDVQSGIELRDQITQILSRGCFKLSKWNSNKPELIPDVHPLNSRELINLDKGESSKVLGLWWNPASDTLNYRIKAPPIKGNLTKRTILSSIAKIYDPVGIISPVLIKAKIIMQELWTLKLGWDDVVPQSIQNEWLKFVIELEYLNKMELPRLITSKSNIETELAVFCDASLRAYGAVVYIRTKAASGEYVVNLLCSRSRVSPIKVLTLPRLELCAALLGAKLMNQVSSGLTRNIRNKYFFTDSMIVLHYLNANANTWQVFVANRVAKIQRISDIAHWYHIDGKSNPADMISRGAYPKQIDCKLYWQGPDFLSQEYSQWPENRFRPTIEINSLPEKRKTTLLVSVIPEFNILSKYSSFTKLQRIIAYALRYMYNLKNKNNKRKGFLSTQELLESHNVIIRLIQQREFSNEYLLLKNNKAIDKNSKIRTLDPFIDKNGLIRVGGRLRNSALNYDIKFPILLPGKHHITQLLIRKEHISLLHAGATQTLASLRTRYWPVRARNVVRKIIHSCVICFRVSPRLVEQRMGDFPEDRLVPCRPFQKIGLDYFGPINIKQGGKRSTKTVKVWVALFVCLVTKAVHLELVGDLTSECFLNALQRFCSRRGKISHIYCDNATTFIGAKRHLDEFTKFIQRDLLTKIHSYLEKECITWKFIPPRSPNFGGLWERLVRSTKYHLKRVVMNANVTWEEAITLLSQIEAIINSRPLTPISNDPSDLQALTPAHFLIGDTLTALPESDVLEIPEKRLSRWERIQKLKQHFWKRWNKEVITQLQAKAKWCQSFPSLTVGTMVLIAEDNLPPLLWKVGRIEKVFPAPDGTVRVAAIRTSQGTYTRSVRKLAVLPLDDAEC